MNITERLRLELLIREQIAKHGDDFYVELERILSKIVSEQHQTPPVGRFRMVI
jgi:hypothetical protein